MKLTMLVPRARLHEWLYYETGFDQLHPKPEIVDSMLQLGYQYGSDWGCETFTNRQYHLWFTTQDMMTAFQLAWS